MNSTSQPDTVKAFCPDGDEYEDLLDSAESEACSAAEQQFVADMRARWQAHGLRAYLSEKQYDWLLRIAKA